MDNSCYEPVSHAMLVDGILFQTVASKGSKPQDQVDLQKKEDRNARKIKKTRVSEKKETLIPFNDTHEEFTALSTKLF